MPRKAIDADDENESNNCNKPSCPKHQAEMRRRARVWERQTEVEIQSRREKEIAKPIQKQEVRKIEEPIKTSLRFQEVQVQGRSKQITTPLRVQGKKKGRINGLSDF